MTGRGADLYTQEMTEEHWERLRFFLTRLVREVRGTEGAPYMAVSVAKSRWIFRL